MKNILLIPSNIDEIKQLDSLVDGYIIPIKNLSTNYSNYFSMDELLEIRSLTRNRIFVSLNKNMHNKDIELLKETLLELSKIDIEGILYYDISIVNLKQELGLKKDLVWAQEHLSTNYQTCNFWYDEGVKYAYLSSEITLDEIKDIKENTSMKLMINIFGYIPMFTSLRPLVNNYLETFDLKDDSKINYMQKEGKIYPITSGENTTIYSNNILNGLDEYLDLDISSFVVNSFEIGSKLKEVLNMYRTVNKENAKEYNDKINSMFANIDKCFLYKETVYKVIK